MIITSPEPNELLTVSSNIFFYHYKTRMDTKHKVILMVFAAFFAVVFLIFVLGGKPKLEKFEEEEEMVDEEEFEEEEKPKESKAVKKEKKAKKDEDVDLEAKKPLDYMKEAMNYLNNMNLPFQVKKEVFSELFSQEGMTKLENLTSLPDVQKYVSNIVDMTKSLTSPSLKEKFNNQSFLTGLEDVKKQIHSLSNSLSSVATTIEKFEKNVDAMDTHTTKLMPPAQPSTSGSPSKSSGKVDVIEGFENVRSNYALF